MSAGERDTLALLIGRTFTYSDPSIYVAEDVAGDTFRIGDVRFSTKALADVLLASDWLREHRADVCDQIIERIRGMEFLGASSLALGGQVAQQEILVLIEQHKRLIPYRTTEDTDAH